MTNDGKVQHCSIFNYAGNNTISAFQGILLNVEAVLNGSCNLMINWFSDDLIQANPQSFNILVFSLGQRIKTPCSYLKGQME